MSDLCGWTGKILRVDLSSGEIWTDDTSKYVPKFIGGIGLGWKIMWDEVVPNVKALSPENRLIFAVGPVTGTEAPASSRTEIIGKSPHTYPVEMVTRSGFGGDFAAYLKFAGFDAIVFQGKAGKPVYLSIDDDKARLEDASGLWGQDAFISQDGMRRDTGRKEAATVAIGQAGENLSRAAAVICGDGHGSGQGGFGAVMGSKNLKGIIVSGTGKVKTAAPAAYMRALARYTKSMVAILQSVVPADIAPRSVWRARKGLVWRGGEEIVEIGEVDPKDLDRMGMRAMAADAHADGKTAPYHVKNVGCFGCPLKCHSLIRMPQMRKYGLPEEGRATCVQFSYNHQNATAESVFAAKQLLDTLGFDAYEMWTIVPMIRWMHQNGFVDEKESGLPFSDEVEGDGTKFISALCRMIAHREGIGDLLAEGSARAAERLGLWEQLWGGQLGLESGYFAHGMHDHYNPRALSIISGLNWMMDNRDPNRHSHNGLVLWSGLPYDKIRKIASVHFGSENAVDPHGLPTPYNPYKGKVAMFIDHRGVIKDSVTLCDWVFPNMVCPDPDKDYIGDTSLESKFFSAVTGIEISEDEMDRMAERAWNLQRAQTIRDWGTKDLRNKHDLIAEWNYIFPEDKDPFTAGGRLDRADAEKAKEDYYRQRGWDVATGSPTRAKLEELDLKEVADDLTRRGLL